MKKLLLVLAATVLSAVVVVGLAVSATRGGTAKLSAKLDAKQEMPKPAVSGAGGTGSFAATLVEKGGKLTWKLTFGGLSGPALAAHIHLGKPGTAGPVAVPLCGPCKSGAHGTAQIPASLVKAIGAGGAYVNVHTAKNQAGEIRGQIETQRG